MVGCGLNNLLEDVYLPWRGCLYWQFVIKHRLKYFLKRNRYLYIVPSVDEDKEKANITF